MATTADSIILAVDEATCHEKSDDCNRIWGGTRKGLAMLLVTQALFETTLAEHVHHNRCRLEIGECDSKRTWNYKEKKWSYVQKAYSLWQLQWFEDIPKSHWQKIQLGVEGTPYAAWHAARRLASAYTACGSIAGAISRYAIGNGCKWEESEKRAGTWDFLMRVSPKLLEKRKSEQKAKLEENDEAS